MKKVWRRKDLELLSNSWVYVNTPEGNAMITSRGVMEDGDILVGFKANGCSRTGATVYVTALVLDSTDILHQSNKYSGDRFYLDGRASELHETETGKLIFVPPK